jgi:hypothetical protein
VVVNARSIEIEIDELALSGFTEGDRDRVAEALKQELTLAVASGVPVVSGASAALRIGYQVDPGASPRQVGRAAARAIAKELTG